MSDLTELTINGETILMREFAVHTSTPATADHLPIIASDLLLKCPPSTPVRMYIGDLCVFVGTTSSV